jgi:two-component system, NtrC family, response regulator AtoC
LGAQAHVLVVEDNELVSSALRILFESVNHRLSVAASVAETLDVAAHDPPDLVFLDLTLPDGDGLATVRPLLDSGCRAIVVLTGHDDVETRERCISAGCAEVLVKPVPSRDLLSKSATLLAASRGSLQ